MDRGSREGRCTLSVARVSFLASVFSIILLLRLGAIGGSHFPKKHMHPDLAAIVELLNWNESAKLPPWLSPIDEGAAQGVAVVLGQSMKPDGSPPEILVKRAQAAKSLLDDGKVTKVIVCGSDPAGVGHTEASVMAKVLRDVGISNDKIIQEMQSTTTAENAWFVLRWIPQGTGQLYLVTSDFHMARASYIFSETFNYFYGMVEDHYQNDPEWKAKAKRYPRLAVHQVAVASFCGSDGSLNKDDDPKADVNSFSLSKRAVDELGFLGTEEVQNDMWGATRGAIMYIWPIQIDVSKDPEEPKNLRAAMAQAMNAVQALCQCVAPPETVGPPLAYPLQLPISSQFPAGMNTTNWKQVSDSCKASHPHQGGVA